MRKIQVPNDWVKKLQRVLYIAIYKNVSIHPASHGFERNRSIYTNAKPHCDKTIVSRYDIKSAFESASYEAIKIALKRDLFEFKFSDITISIFLTIFTYKGFLPTGAPSSPFLLNRVLFNFDEKMMSEARKIDVDYTRYADDLILSGKNALRISGILKKNLSELGFKLNSKKTRIYRKGSRQIVTGLVVNAVPNIPIETRKKLRAAVHCWKKTGVATWDGENISESSLQGHVAYFSMMNKKLAQKMLLSMKKSVEAANI